MNSESLLRIVREGLLIVLLLSSPPLLAALVLGSVSSFLQAVTALQESTIPSVLKLMSVMIVLFYCGPWMINAVVSFFNRMCDAITLIR